MRYRRFGRLGWQVGEIGYGMWGMGGWSGSDDDESFAALDRAVELGCNFFDSALAYGDGHSDGLLGELVRRHPGKRLYTATKVPPKDGNWPSRRGARLEDVFPADHVERSLHESLEHSGLPRFDLLQYHVWEDDWIDDPRWRRTVEELRRQGLVGGIGISLNRWEPWNGVRAVRSGAIDAVQVIHNIFDQAPEDELFPAAQEMDVAIIARVPFDEGSLTGTLTRESTWPADDWRNTYFVPENLNATVERVARLKPLVPAGTTMPALALRYILSHPAVSTVIPGMRKLGHVEANVAASDAGALDVAMIERLREHRWDRQPTAWSQ
ncbi:MAG TPA: aldo/keto reductase [Thermoanaerobaculia bacterium]|jgi:aryl-alcohol dehydrogenase-like predicted oxidoreductase|nr:aldo/keto reductase [Thermoanaerobaculia bacterium]